MEVMKHATTFLLPPDSNNSDGDGGSSNRPSCAVIVLNQRLPRFAPLLWRRGIPSFLPFFLNWSLLSLLSGSFGFLCRAARLRVCADGGANRLFDELPAILSQEDPADVRRRYAFLSCFWFVSFFLVCVWNWNQAMVNSPAMFYDQQGSLTPKNKGFKLRYIIVQLSIYAPVGTPMRTHHVYLFVLCFIGSQFLSFRCI